MQRPNQRIQLQLSSWICWETMWNRWGKRVVKRPTSLFKSFGSNVAKEESELHLPVLTYLNGVAWLLCSFLDEHFFFFFRDTLSRPPINFVNFVQEPCLNSASHWFENIFLLYSLTITFPSLRPNTHISTFRSCFRSFPQVSCSSVVEHLD